MTLQERGDSLLLVSFSMPKLSFLFEDGFPQFDPAMGMNLANGTPGQPALPSLSTLVRLPKGSTLEMEELHTSIDIELALAEDTPPLAPITRAWAKDSERPPFEPDAKTYGSDSFVRNGATLEVEDLGVMGRHQVFRLTVRPMAYNPVQGRLAQYNALHATLRMHKAPATVGGNTLLVVSRPEFQAGLQPFLRWKRQEGYNVKELYVETNLRDSIKEALRPFFDNAYPLDPAPDYILLVGDAAQMQSFIGETTLEGEGHTTDLPYADFSGNYLPEALLGRWPVNDTAELRTIVEKTLRYEQFINIDTVQLQRMLLVAGSEQAGQALLTTNSQVAYVGREAKLAHPELDTVTYHNPESATLLDSIKADIGCGASLLNYTAHCTVGGWTSPALSIGRVEEADADQPMVYINNCCKSNTFSGTGFGEQLLRLPVGGAVGVIGATNSTLWYEDYYWAVGPKWPIAPDNLYDSLTRGAFDALVGSHPSAYTLGELLAAGNLAVSAFGSSYDKFYWEVYCLLGDPTLRPYIGVPARTALWLTDTACNGQYELHVGGTPGATVTALQGDSLLGVGALNANGNAILPLRCTLDTLPLVLTASGAGLRPTVDTVVVERTMDFGATLRSVALADSAVAFTVENTGTQPFDSLYAMLLQSQSDSASGAWIVPANDTLRHLLPGERRTLSLPVRIGTVGGQPLWQGRLMLASDNLGVLCMLEVGQAVPTAYPSVTLRVLNADGTEAQRMNPGSSYRLEASVHGPCDSLRLDVASLPTGERFSSADTALSFSLGDSLCSVHISAATHLGHWHGNHELWLEPGNRIDNLEQGLALHPWRNDSRMPWTLDSTTSHSGSLSLRSGTIDHGQTTQICIDVDLLHPDTVAYWVKTSCESEYDKMTFSVDGRGYEPQAWGIGNWRQRTHPVEAGHHTLCWRYSKDASRSQGEDCVWIDDIQLPLAAWADAYPWQCQTPTVGIDSPAPRQPLLLSPNPAIGETLVNGPRGTRVRITDNMGRTRALFTLDGTPRRLDLALWPAGIYFATALSDDASQSATKKLIVIK
ncbi:MAG: T9SS type A sorting domain-containing protein [Bacteroidales bacterium]|nr:T9SS type A sorting domain-containing protein [Bacteroidales bacterium]